MVAELDHPKAKRIAIHYMGIKPSEEDSLVLTGLGVMLSSHFNKEKIPITIRQPFIWVGDSYSATENEVRQQMGYPYQ